MLCALSLGLFFIVSCSVCMGMRKSATVSDLRTPLLSDQSSQEEIELSPTAPDITYPEFLSLKVDEAWPIRQAIRKRASFNTLKRMFLAYQAQYDHKVVKTYFGPKALRQLLHGSVFETSLHLAVSYGLVDIAQELLKKNKSNVNVRNSNGDTPLLVALDLKDKQTCITMVQLLLRYGADTSISGISIAGLGSQSPLDIAQLDLEDGDGTLMQIFTDRQASLHRQEPLHCKAPSQSWFFCCLPPLCCFAGVKKT